MGLAATASRSIPQTALFGYLADLPAVSLTGAPDRAPWLQPAVLLYLFAGACWLLVVVWLQWRVRDMAAVALRDGTSLPPTCRRYMRIWFVLGWPAFLAVLLIFWLMVAKPALWN